MSSGECDFEFHNDSDNQNGCVRFWYRRLVGGVIRWGRVIRDCAYPAANACPAGPLPHWAWHTRGDGDQCVRLSQVASWGWGSFGEVLDGEGGVLLDGFEGERCGDGEGAEACGFCGGDSAERVFDGEGR